MTFNEYSMLRLEMDDKVKRQDQLFDLTLTLLGLTGLLSTWYQNVLLSLFALFISAVLLVRVQECRNTVYYISAYIWAMEKNNEIDIQWEKNLNKFKEGGYLNIFENKIKNTIVKGFYQFSKILKHLGHLAFTVYIFVRLLALLLNNTKNMLSVVMSISLAVILLLINFIFTVIICSDSMLLRSYRNRWENIIGGKSQKVRNSEKFVDTQ